MNTNWNIELLPLLVSVVLFAIIILAGATVIISKIRHAKEEMRISNEFFQSIFDAAAVGMAVADIDGRYIKVNKAMCDFVGYTEPELIGMSYLDITFPDDVEANVKGRERLLAGEIPTFRLEKRYVCKDGQVVWAVMVVSQILDKSGRVIYTVGQMLDIDTLKRVEQSLRTSQAGLANAQRISRIGDWEWNIEEDIFNWSDEVCDLLEIDCSQLPKTYQGVLAWACPDERALLESVLNEASRNLKAFTIDFKLPIRQTVANVLLAFVARSL